MKYTYIKQKHQNVLVKLKQHYPMFKNKIKYANFSLK